MRSTDARSADRKERRRFFRLDRELVTYYRRAASGDLPPLAALSRNISLGGVLVALEEKFAVEERIELEIVLGDREPPINVHGRVVRVEADGACGIEFLEISPSDAVRLETYLKARGKAGRR